MNHQFGTLLVPLSGISMLQTVAYHFQLFQCDVHKLCSSDFERFSGVLAINAFEHVVHGLTQFFFRSG